MWRQRRARHRRCEVADRGMLWVEPRPRQAQARELWTPSAPPPAAGSRPTSPLLPRPRRGGWPIIAGGRHCLITAPTGSGKTLAAFLWAIDRLMLEAAAVADAPGVGGDPGPLCLAAQGPGLRHRAQSARASGGDCRGRRRAWGPAGAAAGGDPHRRHAPAGAPAATAGARGDPGDHARVPVPAPGVQGGCAPAVRSIRSSSMRSMPWPRPSAGLTWPCPWSAWRSAVPGGQAIPSASGSRRPCGPWRRRRASWVATARWRSSMPPPRRGWTCRSWCRSRTWNVRPRPRGAPARRARSWAQLHARQAPRPPEERGLWSAIYPALLAAIRAHRSTICFVNSRGLAERLVSSPE